MDINNQLLVINSEQGILTKTTDIIAGIKQKVYDGEISAVDTGILLKKLAKISEEIFKDEAFKTVVQDETTKSFTGKSLERFGFKISERATSTFYDFKVCNDPLYNKLLEISEQIKEALKGREEQLKALIPTNNSVAFAIASTEHKTVIAAMPELNWVEGDGEEVTLQQPLKYQKMGLVYTESKE